jgi:4-amino-4-deoxy-L-arabinose transferase-like glycosyltransferase
MPPALALAGACAVLLLATLLLFTGLGDHEVADGDEALYGQVAREMDAAGSWWTPTFWGQAFLHKPPLKYWLIRAGSALASNDLAGLRLSAAAAGWATLALLIWCAHRRQRPLAGLYGALLLLANHQWLFEHGARSGAMDSEATFLTSAALLFGLMAPAERRPALFRAASALAVAFLFMLKSAVALLPLLILLPLLFRESRSEAARYLGWLALAAAAVVLPWHLTQAAAHGRDFFQVYVAYEILGRAETMNPRFQGRTLALRAVIEGFMPFAPLILGAALALLIPGALFPKALYGWRRRGPEAGDRSQLPLFGASLFALALLFALLGVASQWPWYAMPGLPAAALLGGVALERLVYGRSSAWARALLAAAALVPLLLRAVVLAPDPDYQPFLRPSFFWPLESSYYRFVSGAQGLGVDLLLVSLVGAVLGAAWVLESRRPSGRGSTRSRFAPFALALCLLASALVLRDHWRWLSLPPTPSPAAHLIEDLRRAQVERVHLLGFPHQARYGDQLRPLDTWYLGRLGIDRLVDHGADPALAEAGADRAIRPKETLIVNGHSLPGGRLTPPQRARLAERYRVLAWPGSPQGTRSEPPSRAAGPAIDP